MASTLFERYGGGQLVVTQAANAAGRGTRLELFAARSDAGGDWRNPVEIQEPDEANRLASVLRRWALAERRRRRDVEIRRRTLEG